MTATILVIDDSADDQRLYRRALRDIDCRLVLTSTGEDGFASATHLKPDLILLDYHLPDMDGLGFIKLLEKYPCPPLPIVVLTGEGNAEEAVEMMKRGAADYLVKDTVGLYLRLLPTVIARVMAAAAQREETRRLQQETAALLRRNRALMKSSKDGIHVMDAEGNLLEANDEFCRMLGYGPDEVAGLNVADWNAQWTVGELRAKFKSMLGKSAVFETRHRRKDGTLIDVEVSTAGVEIDGQHLFFAASRDISARKRAEEELKLGAQLLDSTSDSVFLLDLDGNFLFLNEAAWKSRGYTRDELMAMNVRELVTPESGTLVAPRIKELMENGHVIFESEHRCKGGAVMSVEVVSRIIESGGRRLILSSCRDITERKKAEAMLRQHKLVIDTSIDGFWMTDMRGNVLEANEAYAKISGYTVEELTGMHISQLEAKEEAGDVKAHIDKIVAQGYDRFETRHRHKDGHEVDIEVSVTHMPEPQRLFVFCRDITERKLAGMELERNQTLLNEAQRLGKLGSWELDVPGGQLRWSAEMYRIFEQDPARFSPSYENFLGTIHPDDRDKVNRAYTQSLRDRKPYDVVHRLLFADGRVKWVREHCTSEFDVAGNPLRSVGMSQDITEHMESEAALQKSEANLRAMLDNSPYLTWLKDAEGRYITVNKVFADYLRLNDAGQAAGKTDLDLQPRELAEKYRADDAEVMAARRQKHVEEAAFDGKTTHWVETFKTPITDAQGNVQGTVGFARDITERKRAEEELRVAAAAFETQDAIVIADADWNITRVNHAFQYITGYSPEEVLGKHYSILECGDDACIEILRQSIDDGTWAGEIWDRRKNGQLYPKWLTITAVRNERLDIIRYVIIFSDITTRKKVEEQKLRESDERFLGTLEQAAVGIAHASPQGLFRQANRKFCDITGYSREELFGMVEQELTFPDDQGNGDETMRQLLAGEISTFAVEKRYVRKDRTLVWVNQTVSVLREADGSPKYLILVIEDITERRRNENLALRFGRLLQGSFNEIYLFDADSLHFLQASEGAKENLGYTDDELQRLTPMNLHPSFTRDSFEELIALLRSGERQSLLFETVQRRKDGSIYPIEVRMQLMEAAPPVFMAVVQDITERRRAESQLREFTAHLQTVREEEKISIAREIHDDLGGTLSAIKMEAYWLKSELSAGMREMHGAETPAIARIQSMTQLVDSAADAARRIITGLRPAILDDFGLLAAIEWQCAQFQQRTGIECRVNCVENRGALDKARSIALFRILQEALTNVMKYAGASRVEVEFLHGGGEVMLSVHDNGHGLAESLDASSGHYGMLGMVERAEQLGGTVSFDSQPGSGLGVVVRLPLSAFENEGTQT
ncbi:MAG TPA: PAS domain S-box protein [Gallionella sp.]|nr:PAS domain S-box protein [Gallionella sp.]